MSSQTITLCPECVYGHTIRTHPLQHSIYLYISLCIYVPVTLLIPSNVEVPSRASGGRLSASAGCEPRAERGWPWHDVLCAVRVCGGTRPRDCRARPAAAAGAACAARGVAGRPVPRLGCLGAGLSSGAARVCEQ